MTPRRVARVVVVDDSPLALEVLCAMLGRAPDIEVAGTAAAGDEALDLVRRLRPDVLLTDLHMPGLDGLGLTRAIMRDVPTPILVVSSSTSEDDVFRLLGAGAVDVFLKPEVLEGAAYERKVRELTTKVRVASGVSVFRRRSAEPLPPPLPLPPVTPACVVAVGASTGGPQALRELLGALPASFPVPIVCVQHIAEGFLDGLVDWLQGGCALRVKVAQEGEPLRAGTAYFAPDGRHLALRADLAVELRRGPPVDGHLPSVTALFRSAAATCGADAIGILLTGMGRDGADGLLELRRRGALTIAQDADTSLVYGMPGQAVASGAARRVLPLPQIAACLAELRLHAEDASFV